MRLDRLQRGVPIVEKTGAASSAFQSLFQRVVEQIEAAFQSQQEQIDAIAAAQAAAAAAQAAADTAQTAADAAATAAANADTAATNAQGAADETKAETSLVNSYPANPSGGTLITADNTGLVTIDDHDRIYGDTTLNPTVAVDGDAIATGEGSGSIVRIYYVDSTRSGGSVSYLFTVDPAPPPVQGGDTHSVGAVEIPAGAPVGGGPVRPPGYANPLP